MGLLVHEQKDLRHFSRNLMCPTTGDAYPDPEPNLFSFNSPYGACSQCNGLGEVAEAEIGLIIPDDKKSIQKGGIAPLGEIKGSRTMQIIQALLDASGDTLKTPIQQLTPEVLGEILYGCKESVWVSGKAGTKGSHVTWEGVIATVESAAERSNSIPLRRWARRFMKKKPCPSCAGARLKPTSLQFKLGGKNIAELSGMDLKELSHWFLGLNEQLTEK